MQHEGGEGVQQAVWQRGEQRGAAGGLVVGAGGGGSHAVRRAVPRQQMHSVGVGVEERQSHPQT